MPVTDRRPRTPRRRTSCGLAVAVVLLAAPLARPGAAPPDGATPKAEGSRTWTGRVTEKGTGRPIAGADVVVEISVSRDRDMNEPRTLRKVRHTTGAEGAYEFTVTPEEAGERLLYITLIVEAPGHVNYFGGYGYGMILKNEKLGERAFFENLELAPGEAI